MADLDAAGQDVSITALGGEALREQVPLASPSVTAALSVNGQRFIDPGRFVRALERSVTERGYSFTVPVDRPLPTPIYLPEVRVACTPYQGAMRVAGTMEFRDPDQPAVAERVGAIVASASPLLDGVRWDERTDIWVGSRPVTADGRPVIGEISRHIYVAGGHGMWGLAHGPSASGCWPNRLRPANNLNCCARSTPLR